jgi:hypothetical protein
MNCRQGCLRSQGVEQGHLYTQIARNLLGLATEEKKVKDASDKDRDERKRAGAFAD